MGEDETTRPPDESTDKIVGICLSGGGVRSASFCLGALQALQMKLGYLKGKNSADYISAVSGGSYTAAALYLSAFPSEVHMAVAGNRGIWGMTGERGENDPGWIPFHPNAPLWPGSPEALHMRRHSRYISEPSLPLNLAIILSLAVFNVVVLLTMLALSGATIGVLTRWTGLLTFDPSTGEILRSAVSGGTRSTWIFVLTVWLMLLFARFRASAASFRRRQPRLLNMSRRFVTAKIDDPYARSTIETKLLEWSYYLTITIVLVVIGYATADVVWPAVSGANHDRISLTAISKLMASGLSVATGLGVAAYSLARSPVAGLSEEAVSRTRRAVGRLRFLIGSLLQAIVSALTVLLMASAFYVGWLVALSESPTTIYRLMIAIGLTLYLTSRFGGLANRGLFGFYKSRLSQCYDLIRQVNFDHETLLLGERGQLYRARQRRIAIKMQDLNAVRDMPELRICASANISEHGATPAGSHARPIVFTPSGIHMPAAGSAVLGDSSIPWNRVDGKLFDGEVMSCVALTGAAISPAMGKFTIGWLRGILTLLNLRLGIWIPSPVAKNRSSWSKKWRRPSFWYYFRELRGVHYLGSKFIYVTDGGHYENLGLLELARQGCTDIWCIDASGDTPGVPSALAEAASLLSAELGFDLILDLEDFSLVENGSGAAGPTMRRVFSRGVIQDKMFATDPDRARERGLYKCEIKVVKIGLDRRSSHRFKMARSRYESFPHDSTANQLYDAERFDLYRDLGFESTARAIDRRD